MTRFSLVFAASVTLGSSALVPRSDGQPLPNAAPPAKAVPAVPLERSAIVRNHAVAQKDGKFIDGTKLSQHDLLIGSPTIAVGSDGVIHVAFVEQHPTTNALAVYYRSSGDHGATWTEAKNLTEDMPGINVGRCVVLADSSDRVYVIWRAGLGQYFPASMDPAFVGNANLFYRVRVGGKWSGIKPVSVPASDQNQLEGALSYFAAIDAAGRAQVIWNARPEKWHPELTVGGQQLSGVGPGLVFQVTLDGANPSAPREVFLTPITGRDTPGNGAYGTSCDGLDSLNGYFDAGGSPHFTAAITRTHDSSLQGKHPYRLIENGALGPEIDLPDLSFHAARDVPTLLVDAAGRRHLLVLYLAGERPGIRDYLIGTDEEPVTVRSPASAKGTIAGFQACQGPGGEMVAIMQMNDSGDTSGGETYVAIGDGNGWSAPVSVTNNAGRLSYASTQLGTRSNVTSITSYGPGPGAAAFDREGRLLLLMITYETRLFGLSASGYQLAGGSSSTPTLQFLRF